MDFVFPFPRTLQIDLFSGGIDLVNTLSNFQGGPFTRPPIAIQTLRTPTGNPKQKKIQSLKLPFSLLKIGLLPQKEIYQISSSNHQLFQVRCHVSFKEGIQPIQPSLDMGNFLQPAEEYGGENKRNESFGGV